MFGVSNRDHFPVELIVQSTSSAEVARLDSVKTHLADVLEIDRLGVVVQCRR